MKITSNTHFIFNKKLILGQLNGKLSVLKPPKSRNLTFFFSSLSYYSFEDTITNFERDMFRKESLTYKQNLNIQFLVIFVLPVYSVVQTLIVN